jgi:hypothetical protein
VAERVGDRDEVGEAKKSRKRKSKDDGEETREQRRERKRLKREYKAARAAKRAEKASKKQKEKDPPGNRSKSTLLGRKSKYSLEVRSLSSHSTGRKEMFMLF